jgi:hypothetical protein
VSRTDFDATVAFAHTAAQVMDGVGLFCFGPASEAEPTTYRIMGAPREIGMDQVLYRACQDLTALQREAPEPIPSSAVGPATEAQAALSKLGEEGAESEDRA